MRTHFCFVYTHIDNLLHVSPSRDCIFFLTHVENVKSAPAQMVYDKPVACTQTFLNCLNKPLGSIHSRHFNWNLLIFHDNFRLYRRLCLQLFCILVWRLSLMQFAFFALLDVFCCPPQIPAWCEEPLLVRGIHREYHFGPIQDKLVRTLLEALPHSVSAVEEHFPRTLDSPRWKTVSHAMPSLFLYHWSTKVWHDGSV